jgi:uncharacterized protein
MRPRNLKTPYTTFSKETALSQYKLALFLIILCLSSFASSQVYPARPADSLNDFADVLDQDSETRIREMLSRFKQNRQIEMKVITIGSVTDYGFDGEIEPFATGLFNYWGIGDAARNDGILMLIAIQDRSMRLELGAGYPKQMDRTAKNIIDQVMIPAFKQQNYASGIEKGVQETINLIRLDGGSPERSSSLYLSDQSDSENGLMTFFKWAAGVGGGILATILGLFQANKWNRERPRVCPKCKGTMQLLPEDVEDRHLNEGQETEERVNSVQYDVWYCPADETVEVCSYNRWFSGYSQCKFCSRKTLSTNSVTLRQATQYSTGTSKVYFNCEHCKKNWTEMHVIPQLTSNNSSSSSGGRSSGGGASGRW